MNQEHAKNALLSLGISVPDFTLLFSGKKSGKVNGVYKPALHEIIIHTGNFEDNENDMMVTIIHEFTHHVASTRKLVSSARAHNATFWSLFHSILRLAIEKKLYIDPCSTVPELKQKNDEIRKVLEAQTDDQQRLGMLLMEMQVLCSKNGARFDDYIDRHARIPRKAAQAAVTATAEVDLDGMKGSISPQAVELIVECGEKQSEAADRFADGQSIQQVSVSCKQNKDIDPLHLPPETEETKDEALERLMKRRAVVQAKIVGYKDEATLIDFQITELQGQGRFELDEAKEKERAYHE